MQKIEFVKSMLGLAAVALSTGCVVLDGAPEEINPSIYEAHVDCAPDGYGMGWYFAATVIDPQGADTVAAVSATIWHDGTGEDLDTTSLVPTGDATWEVLAYEYGGGYSEDYIQNASCDLFYSNPTVYFFEFDAIDADGYTDTVFFSAYAL